MPLQWKEQLFLEKLIARLIGLLLFMLPWQTIWIIEEKTLNGVKWEWGTLGFYATEVVLWFCVFLFIPWYWKNIASSFQLLAFRFTRERQFVLSCLLFLVFCFLSVAWAVDRDIAFQQAFRVLEAVLLFFMLFIGPLPWQKAASWFVAGAVGQSLLGIWQFLTQSTFASTVLGITEHPASLPGSIVVQSDAVGRWLRAYGAFTHPNVFGGYLVLALAVALLRLSEKKSLLMSIASVLLTAGIFFSFSRSAWIATVVIFALALAISRHAKDTIYRLSLIALSFGILAAIFHSLVFVRMSAVSASEVRSVGERLSGYAEAHEIILSAPLAGVGIGNYTTAAYGRDSSRKGWEYQPVHSVALLVLAELGLAGVVLFGVVVLSGVYMTYKTNRTNSLSLIFYLLFFIAPLALFDHYLFSSYVGLAMVAVFLGLIGKLLYTASPQE